MATEPADRVWELMQEIGTCMLVTRDGDEMHCRPMAATLRRDENAIYFLTDVTCQKDDEIQADRHVALTFADTGGEKYVAVTGHAEVSDDREKIQELWTPFAKAWWESAEDPNIRVLRVTPEDAEYWDSPGTLATYVTMVAAAVIGTRPKMGESRKVAM